MNSWYTADFRVQRPKSLHSVLTTTTKKVTFSFPEFVSTHQKSVYEINYFLRFSRFWGSETRVATPITDHAHTNIFQSTFDFHESVSKFKKSGFFDFSQIWDLSKNTANIKNFTIEQIQKKIND